MTRDSRNPAFNFFHSRRSISAHPLICAPHLFQDRAQLRHLAADHGPDAAHAAAVRQDARKVQEGPPRRHD